MSNLAIQGSTLAKLQIQLEQDTFKEAMSRQDNELKSAAKREETGSTKYGSLFTQLCTGKMVDNTREFIHRKGPGKKHTAGVLLKNTGIEPEVIAYLAAKAVFNVMGSPQKHVPGKVTDPSVKRMRLIRAIGEKVHDEYRVRFFAEDKNRKMLLRKLMKDMDRRTYPRPWRKRTIKIQFDAAMLDWDAWGDSDKLHVGAALLHIFVQSTSVLIETHGGTRYDFHPEFIDMTKDVLSKQTSQFIIYRPMLVPPYDWDDGSGNEHGRVNLFRGGYITKDIPAYPIIKGATKRDTKRFTEMDWSRVLPAINALQRTPWRVNSHMVEALDWAFYTFSTYDDCPKIGIGKMARCEDEVLPPEPEGYRTDEAITKAHNRICFEIHDRNRQNKSKRLQVIMNLNAAKMFQQYEAIYYPHDLDTRGRAYPKPSLLSPQGPDFVKALLEFANGQPIETQEAADWLAIAVANAYGNDKVSLQERVQWVYDNEDMILSIAKDYKHDLRWVHTSEPFCFLRGCIEWAGFVAEGWGYTSHMVIPVDATCSGLQHYGAMLRDEVGGRSVNLVPGLSRQDIYGDVASVVRNALAIQGSSMANDWLTFGIDRKMTKRQVMVVPYAATFSSCMSYTREAFDEKINAGVACPWDRTDEKDHNERLTFLAKLIWAAISDVVVKGKLGMEWLTSVAKEVAKVKNDDQTVTHPYELRMTWTTPDGFEVVHFREDEEKYRFKTMMDGPCYLVAYRGTGKLHVKDMGLAVAPNFVHALDATLLRATVIKALDHGITDFAMIHDSFGVHASKMADFLAKAIKPAFVEMYEQNDVLAQFRERFLPLCPDLPEPPEKGTLDLQGVLRSEFFFS